MSQTTRERSYTLPVDLRYNLRDNALRFAAGITAAAAVTALASTFMLSGGFAQAGEAYNSIVPPFLHNLGIGK